VPPEVAAARRDELMAAQQEVHFARARERVGTTIDVLVETVEPFGRRAVGRGEHDAPEVDGKVRVEPAPRGARAGSFVRATVTAADGYDLVATPAGAAAEAPATAGAGPA
jgi:ribosomal protein S12 methylthiotransferase